MINRLRGAVRIRKQPACADPSTNSCNTSRGGACRHLGSGGVSSRSEAARGAHAHPSGAAAALQSGTQSGGGFVGSTQGRVRQPPVRDAGGTGGGRDRRVAPLLGEPGQGVVAGVRLA